MKVVEAAAEISSMAWSQSSGVCSGTRGRPKGSSSDSITYLKINIAPEENFDKHTPVNDLPLSLSARPSQMSVKSGLILAKGVGSRQLRS